MAVTPQAPERAPALASRPPWRDGGWHSGALQLASPNADERPAGMAIDLLVIHYISLPAGRFSGTAVQDLFLNRLDLSSHESFESLRGLRVSSHFFIRRDGSLMQFVDGDRRAWHAGQSRFEERSACNDFSIGIEMEGDGAHAFTRAQYRRLTRLTEHLLGRYPLRAVRGHSDIAPGRKPDPGPCFDWSHYADSLERLSDRLSSRPGAKIFLAPQLGRLAHSIRQRT